MTPTERHAESLSRAEAWLAAQHEGGCYRRYLRFAGGRAEPELGTFSAEITGYAAHYWSWRALSPNLKGRHFHKARAREAAEWLVNEWRANNLHLPFEPGSPLQYFFDLGIAARGLFAAGRALEHPPYIDVATQMTAAMKLMEWPGVERRATFTPIVDFQARVFHNWHRPAFLNGRGFDNEWLHRNVWWSQGPFMHQRKAALAWKIAGDRSTYDLLDLGTSRTPFDFYSPDPEPTFSISQTLAIDSGDLATFFSTSPGEESTGQGSLIPKAKGKGTAAKAAPPKNETDESPTIAAGVITVPPPSPDPVHVARWAADYCHPFAYSAEASCMGDISGERGLKELALLKARITAGEVTRTDVYAQWMRLQLYMHQGGVTAADLDQLISVQDDIGGFRFILVSSFAAEQYAFIDLSVHATFFACQAIAMAGMIARNEIPNQKFPFGSRELAIV